MEIANPVQIEDIFNPNKQHEFDAKKVKNANLAPENSINVKSIKTIAPHVAELDVRTIYSDGHQKKIPFLKKNPLSKNHSNSETDSVSDSDSNSDSNSDSDSETNSNDDDEPSHQKKRKNKQQQKKLLLSELIKYKKSGFKTSTKIGYKNSIFEIEAEYLAIKSHIQYKQKIQFFRFILWAFSWIAEKVSQKVTNSHPLKNWNKHVHRNIHKYDQYYDELTNPTVYDEKMKLYRKVKGNGVFNIINDNPYISLAMAISMDGVWFVFANNIDKFSDIMSDDDDDDI